MPALRSNVGAPENRYRVRRELSPLLPPLRPPRLPKSACCKRNYTTLKRPLLRNRQRMPWSARGSRRIFANCKRISTPRYRLNSLRPARRNFRLVEQKARPCGLRSRSICESPRRRKNPQEKWFLSQTLQGVYLRNSPPLRNTSRNRRCTILGVVQSILEAWHFPNESCRPILTKRR